MPSAAPHQAQMECAPAQAGDACPPVAEDGAGDSLTSACVGLSNDYLNHYSEALMLIEMAVDDPAIGADLAEWRPVSYRSYFGASELRRASAALAAYDALPPDRRAAFEKLVAAMDSLATMAVFALQPPYEKETAPIIAEATVPTLRALIARAAAFLNSGGQDLAPDRDGEEAQIAIDRILGHAAQRGDG